MLSDIDLFETIAVSNNDPTTTKEPTNNDPTNNDPTTTKGPTKTESTIEAQSETDKSSAGFPVSSALTLFTALSLMLATF